MPESAADPEFLPGAMAMSYDDDRPVPPIRITSVREKNGPTSSTEKEKKKGLLGWGSKRGAGEGTCGVRERREGERTRESTVYVCVCGGSDVCGLKCWNRGKPGSVGVLCSYRVHLLGANHALT